MLPPKSYAEWSVCLEALATGLQDEEVIQAMSQGVVNWSSGWAEQFSERLFETINIRLSRCADRMDREFALGFNEPTIVRAMLDARRTLALLHRVATLPSFPATLQTHVGDEICKYATRTQQSLELSAKSDRSGQLSRMIRRNSLLGYAQQANAHAHSGVSAPTPPQSRTVLLDNAAPSGLQGLLKNRTLLGGLGLLSGLIGIGLIFLLMQK